MECPRTGRIIAFNGEVYNVRELRHQLAAESHGFRGTSDTEVVLAAYDQWGERCVEEMVGMFAFAVWDAPRQRLFLARDRLGIKPLYLCRRDSDLAFASELRCLLLGDVSAGQISEPGLASYLTFGAVQEPWSLIDDISVLPPGHRAFVEDGVYREQQYWSLSEAFEGPGLVPERRSAPSMVRALLENAVREHLISDAPIGVFLSGGIDSTSLLALATEVSGEAPRTFSLVFAEQDHSEERYIGTAARRYESEHTEVRLTAQDLLESLPGAVGAMDQPSLDGINTFTISGLARQAGLKAALSGIGGDEIFAGYRTFRTTRRLEVLHSAMPALGPSAQGLMGRLAQRSDQASKGVRWMTRESPWMSACDLQREVLDQESVRRVAPGVHRYLSGLGRPEIANDVVNRVSYQELDRYMRNTLLRDADVMGMARGLEIRVPFLDHRVLELVARMPGSYKRTRQKSKPLLVEAMGALLPTEVVQRPKMGFTLPFDHWLRKELRDDVDATLRDASIGGPLTAILDQAGVNRVWERFLVGHTSWSRPWALYTLKQWGQTMGDTRTRRTQCG